MEAVIIGSGGMLDGLVNKEAVETVDFGAKVAKLNIVTVFAYACKAEVLVDEKVVATVEAAYNKIGTASVNLGNGAGIDTGGVDKKIELKATHVRMGGMRYAASATVVGA